MAEESPTPASSKAPPATPPEAEVVHAIVKPCGPCSLCCKLMAVNVLAKPSGQWCAHFRKGIGCAIHSERPAECRRFQCYWSISTVLGDAWRPDRARFMLWSNAEGRVIVEVDPSAPFAWKRAPYYAELKAWTNRRRPLPLQVLVRSQGRTIVLFPEADIDLGPQPAGMTIDAGYRMQDGRETPYALFVAPPPS